MAEKSSSSFIKFVLITFLLLVIFPPAAIVYVVYLFWKDLRDEEKAVEQQNWSKDDEQK